MYIVTAGAGATAKAVGRSAERTPAYIERGGSAPYAQTESSMPVAGLAEREAAELRLQAQ